ncbi:MAG TPA: extracellular solute-binding protein, partial [Candidatus Synoicihabitans sp.]|nr:extracellular solute-binding protein [Candidatus Synoicihabitans sp.]
EAIRHEFGRGFEQWYHERTGRRVFIDWRVIGGTSEIARFLEGEYVASFRNYWTGQLNRPWSLAVQAAFQDGRLGADAPAEAREAREAFLASQVSCGIDLFFGGGTYDFVRQASAGRIVDSGVLQRFPEWFRDDVIPHEYAGEEYWDKEGRWVGTVLSSYGVVYNRDALQRLGLERAPAEWDDLQDPRFFGEVALADPTKSGSIAKAFENVVQQQMQRRLVELQRLEPEAAPVELERRAVREGWLAGMRLLQRIGANSRYFTDTSQKPNIDVAAGNCAVGMTIDFYGRQQAEALARRGDPDRIGYVSPVGGSVSSVDPIALLRGAPNRGAALAFFEFVLSMEGQKLWNFRAGAPGGPERFGLRRLPVRRDFYQQGFEEFLSDPEARPYEESDQLIYRAAWTSPLFRELAFIIRVMCQDTHHELTTAWREILAAGQPAEALAVLHELGSVTYDEAAGPIKRALGSRNKVEEIELAKTLGNTFRGQYQRAAEIARAAARPAGTTAQTLA